MSGDVVVDVLLESVLALTEILASEIWRAPEKQSRCKEIVDKLNALIAQRKGGD